MKTIVLAALLLLPMEVWGQSQTSTQDHAPALWQCNADANLWSQTGPEQEQVLTVKDLQNRNDEMKACIDAYPSEKAAQLTWVYMGESSLTAIGIKAMNFINRHKLMEQFLAEDAAGKR